MRSLESPVRVTEGGARRRARQEAPVPTPATSSSNHRRDVVSAADIALRHAVCTEPAQHAPVCTACTAAPRTRALCSTTTRSTTARSSPPPSPLPLSCLTPTVSNSLSSPCAGPSDEFHTMKTHDLKAWLQVRRQRRPAAAVLPACRSLPGCSAGAAARLPCPARPAAALATCPGRSGRWLDWRCPCAPSSLSSDPPQSTLV